MPKPYELLLDENKTNAPNETYSPKPNGGAHSEEWTPLKIATIAAPVTGTLLTVLAIGLVCWRNPRGVRDNFKKAAASGSDKVRSLLFCKKDPEDESLLPGGDGKKPVNAGNTDNGNPDSARSLPVISTPTGSAT